MTEVSILSRILCVNIGLMVIVICVRMSVPGLRSLCGIGAYRPDEQRLFSLDLLRKNRFVFRLHDISLIESNAALVNQVLSWDFILLICRFTYSAVCLKI